MSEVDINVMSHDKVELTASCIKAVYKNTSIPFNMTVIDDSTDLTPQWCDEWAKTHDNFKVVRPEKPFANFADIFNFGRNHTEAPYIVNLDNSTTVEPGWLDLSLPIMKENPEIGVMGFKLINKAGCITHAGVQIGNDNVVNRGLMEPGHRLVETREVDAVGFAVSLFRREAIIEGWTSSPYIDWGGFEDLDTCLRLREQGWKIVYCGFGAAYHVANATKADKPGWIDSWKANEKIFYDRWPDYVHREVATMVAVG